LAVQAHDEHLVLQSWVGDASLLRDGELQNLNTHASSVSVEDADASAS